MVIRFDRCVGTVHNLEPGEYTLLTASGNPALRCPACGGIFDLSVAHTWDADGRVAPAVHCPTATCNFFELVELVELAAIGEEVLA